MSGLRFGVLTEDETDADTLDVLVRRLTLEVTVTTIGIKKYWSNGCARLRAKAASQMKRMADDGCTAFVLVHDLDRDPNNGQLRDEATLRAQLEAIKAPARLPRFVCIPVEELEAWFWSDPKVVEKVGRGAGKAHLSPHLISKPKEALEKLSKGANKKPLYSTSNNEDLARELDLALCAERCPAFAKLRAFVRGLVAPSA